MLSAQFVALYKPCKPKPKPKPKTSIIYVNINAGNLLNIKAVFSGIAIPIIKYMMENRILVRQPLYIETVPRSHEP